MSLHEKRTTGHADRTRAKAELYALVQALYDHGMRDVAMFSVALNRSPQRIRQVLADLDITRARHSLRDQLSGLPQALRERVMAFGGVTE